MRLTAACIGFSAALLALQAVPAGAAPPSLEGKTVRVIVPYAAGGAVDVVARLLASHVGKHLSGRPTIIVENMPGAGGARGANYLYNVAPKDGTAFGVTIPPFTVEFIGRKGVRFESAKFNWIGSFNISQVTFVHKSLAVKSARDLLNSGKELVIGGLRPNSARDLRMRAFLEALGIKNYKYVSGYGGTAAVRQAILRGEVNFSDEAAAAIVTSLRSPLEDGTIVPFVQTGLTRDGKRVPDPRLADVPLAEETVVALRGEAVRSSVEYRAMRAVIGMVALGRAIILPPGVDTDAVSAWRDAIAKLNSDADFQRHAAKQSGGVEMILTSGAESQALAREVSELVTKDPQALSYLEKLAKGK